MRILSILALMTTVASIQAVDTTLDAELQEFFAGAMITRSTSTHATDAGEATHEAFTATFPKGKRITVSYTPSRSPNRQYWVTQRNEHSVIRAKEQFEYLRSLYDQKSEEKK